MTGEHGQFGAVRLDAELLLVARWGARPQSLDSVAQAVLLLAERIVGIVGGVVEPLEPAEVDLGDLASVTRWVEATVFRDEAGVRHSADGYSVDLRFEQGETGQVLAAIRAGREASGARIAANAVELTVRGDARAAIDALLETVVVVWDPDFASVVDAQVVMATRVPGRSVRLGYRSVISPRLVRTLNAPPGYVLDRSPTRIDLRLTGPADPQRVAAAAHDLTVHSDLAQLAQHV